ncbi:hypothetical protein [Gloeocapsa sp. PCC 73106]|uniref:hypothetical protein n=1 Tax=Gloeocapsa sp. PCC 73106 TaxID=102232 RepID=UPI0002AC4295|nr:hypothetical protein [Gloeocapsa sp. PCC 73106]ELS00111.1 hypothetical protein GLO73106DRAFT_00039660 [Gloeocapsa sp. PCC 73106]
MIEDNQENPFEKKPTKAELKKLEEDVNNELDRKREDTRSVLAKRMIWILIGTYISSFVLTIFIIFFPIESPEERTERYTYSKDIFTLFITNQVGLIGAVLGFYFGSNRSRN